MITVPGRAGHTVKAALEDARPAIPEDSFAALCREANDDLDDDIFNLTSSLLESNVHGSSSEFKSGIIHGPDTDSHPDDIDSSADIDDNKRQISTHAFGGFYGCGASQVETRQQDDGTATHPDVGDRLSVFWPLDNTFYDGSVQIIDQNSCHNIQYHDGDKEVLNLSSETWRFCSATTSKPLLRSELPNVLSQIFDVFGNKLFMRQEAQSFPSCALTTPYTIEETEFKKTRRVVPLDAVPKGANIVGSHVLYKVRVMKNSTLKLKARIAPHGNDDSVSDSLRSDCTMCSMAGFRTLLSTAVLRKWRVSRIDVASTSLKTGDAQREVYVIPPRERTDRGKFLWLFLVAVYGLVNSNSKWKSKFDKQLETFGFTPASMMPQLFRLDDNDGTLVALVSKVVDDILFTGVSSVVDNIISRLNDKFPVGIVLHGPGSIRMFGLNVVQDED